MILKNKDIKKISVKHTKIILTFYIKILYIYLSTALQRKDKGKY